MQLDYVSPLPPVPSGIADYSVDLLRELRAMGRLGGSGDGTVHVVQVSDQEVDESLSDEFGVAATREVGTSRVPVYQVGNNEHHAPIVELAERRPGIITLHDVFLHHLLIERTLGHGDLDGYVDALRRDHGWVGARVALPPRWGVYAQAGLFTLPAHRSLLEAQRGVLVHSEWARRELREDEVNVAVRVLSMPMPTPVLDLRLEARAEALRDEWGIPRAAQLLGSFGFQTPIKRTRSAICALARPELAKAHLLVAGKQSPGLELEGVAAELGVAARVHFVGYLAREDFAAAIRSCDLCINLRYPTAGETSASLLRILALGRATAVSDFAQFADLPDEFALKVDLGDDPSDPSSGEVEALAGVCADALSDPQKLQHRGDAARRFVEQNHQPRRSAEQFLSACEELSGLGGEEPRAVVVPRPTSLTWGEMQCVLEVGGAEEWQPGERRSIEVQVRNDSECIWLAADEGDGGVMLEVSLLDSEGREWAPQQWMGLPHRLAPGRIWRTEIQLRRPLGRTILEVEPHVVGGSGVSHLRGERLRREFDDTKDSASVGRAATASAAESLIARPTEVQSK